MSQTNRYQNSALNEKTLSILEQAQTELAPKKREQNDEYLWLKSGDKKNLKFVVTDEEGDRHPEFNKEVEVPQYRPEGSTEPEVLIKKRQFRIINMSDGGKSQLFQIGKKHARAILKMMQELNTSEVTVMRLGQGLDTNYVAIPLQPEPVA